jgi:hypothetical protein
MREAIPKAGRTQKKGTHVGRPAEKPYFALPFATARMSPENCLM